MSCLVLVAIDCHRHGRVVKFKAGKIVAPHSSSTKVAIVVLQSKVKVDSLHFAW